MFFITTRLSMARHKDTLACVCVCVCDKYCGKQRLGKVRLMEDIINGDNTGKGTKRREKIYHIKQSHRNEL